MPNPLLAYFITFTCYGTWLHGDDRGSVDGDHNAPGMPTLCPNAKRRACEQSNLKERPYSLDAQRRQVILDALCEIAQRKGWTLHAAHVRSTHVHIVVTAVGTPERVMNDLKTAASRQLNRGFPAEKNRKRWTRHGSTLYLWTEQAVNEKVHYVLDGLKAVAGEHDLGGGIVWRYQDANNYYVVRMNPLEDNYRVYKVVAGKRTQLDTKEDVKVASGTWHRLKIKMIGDHIECYLDGKKLLDARDGTFQGAGQVGLWSKADAQTYFDEAIVRRP
jgi:REP element-mobilizing transposase RayT